MPNDPGLYRILRQPPPTARRAVFLDRDGVVIEETGYLHRPPDVRYIAGALSAIARLNQSGFAVVLITNQAGVGRGYYGWSDFVAVQQRIAADLSQSGGYLDGVWACGYHPEGKGPLALDHPHRKPNPGMILEAAETFGLDLAQSWLVGDKLIDIEAGLRAGLRGSILVRTGYGSGHEASLAAYRHAGVHVCNDLPAATDLILQT